MWINRSYQDLISKSLALRPGIVLTGGRQTGKTSLLKKMFPDYSFVTLDLPSAAEHAEKDPKSFLEKHPPPIIIDEVQYAPALFRHIKICIDQHRTQNGQFLLTGSQKFTLMKAVGDSLAGRIDLFELETLSLAELRNADISMPIEEIVLRGGFPELYEKPDLDKNRFLSAYLATYLERDVKGLLNVTQLRDFERFLRACALRSGQLLNKAELANDIGISPSTSNAWISVLVASGQLVLIEPWFSNKTKSLVKSPKLYLADSGLLNFLLNIESLPEMLKSPKVGNIWETYVFSELRKIQQSRLGTWRLHFWRDRQKEVDFVDDRGGILNLLECKWTETPSKQDAEGLLYVEKKVGKELINKKQIICRTNDSFPMGQDVQVINLDDLKSLKGFANIDLGK